jgi:glyoxylate reductase
MCRRDVRSVAARRSLPGVSRPVVLVARRLLPAGLEALASEYEIREGGLDAERARILELAPGAAAIVADPTVAVDDALLDAAGDGLRVVANFAVGHDNVDLDACRRRGIPVTNTPDVLTNATAELALALTLAAARRTTGAEADLRAGRWTGWDPAAHLGLELSGASFAVVGLGRIGRRYAQLVHGFAGELLYVGRSRKAEAEAELGASRVELDEALERSDVVSLHAPASPESHHLVGSGQLARMKPTAVLVNTARGSLVDGEALAAALQAGEIGAAGLDVFEGEPEVPAALLSAPRAVLLPHIGSATTTARDGMARTVAANVLAALRGEDPPNRVA